MARCEECLHYKVCLDTETRHLRMILAGEKAERCKQFMPTAEVVPKSEVEALQEALSKAEADVKNYMKVAEYQQSLSVKRYHEIKRLNEEVERLQEENETLKDNNEHLAVLLEESKQPYSNYKEKTGLKQAKQAYAKEIISEMDNRLHDMAMEYANRYHKEYFAVCEMVHHKVIRPVEKKYAEGD